MMIPQKKNITIFKNLILQHQIMYLKIIFVNRLKRYEVMSVDASMGHEG